MKKRDRMQSYGINVQLRAVAYDIVGAIGELTNQLLRVGRPAVSR